MMFVKQMIVDDSERLVDGSSQTEVDNPSLSDIDGVIRRLDGKYRTMIVLAPYDPQEEYMYIGGGKNGFYVCGTCESNGTEYVLFDPAQKSDELVSIPMGQPISRSRKECMNMEQVLLGAQTYAQSGKRDVRFSWKEC
jgi:hypothetical protein